MKITAMQTLNVSLVIRSRKISLDEMTKRLGSPEKDISFEKGRKVRIPSKGEVTLEFAFWVIESKLPETAPLDRHLKEIIKQTGGKAKLAKKLFGNNVRISLKIGVFYDFSKSANAYCHINIKAIQALLPFVDVIEMSAYPCTTNNKGFNSIDNI